MPASQIQEQIVDVGGSGIVGEIPEEKVVDPGFNSVCWSTTWTSKDQAQKRVQRRFAEVQDLVVVSEDSRFLRNVLLRGWPGFDALLAQVSLDDDEEVMEEEIPEVQLSRFQGVFRPRRLCPNLLRGSRCHYGKVHLRTHAFHELADEGWYVPGSTSDW